MCHSIRVSPHRAAAAFALIVCLSLGGTVFSQQGEGRPIQQHPENPGYFLFRGEAVALVTSAEHYGAVLNREFDFEKYLETLAKDGLNYTRIFAGSYVEPQGAFGIDRNTLAPAPGRFLSPWARSDTPGYAAGGNRLDLSRFNPEYFSRLAKFVETAGDRKIVVELTFFSSTYTEKNWNLHPLNPSNNIQQYTVSDWRRLNTLDYPEVVAYQEQFVRRIVRELADFDNVFFEIQNEPWSDNHVYGEKLYPYWREKDGWPNAVEIPTADAVAWQRRIAAATVDEEEPLEAKHLIAQNVANFRLAVRESDLVPEARLLNFHYAFPEAVTWNDGLGRIIGYDESGFAGHDDSVYRRQAWNFMFAGGGLFNNLDYSFAVGAEDGSLTDYNSPGGGSAKLRRQLGTLIRFLHRFDLSRMAPDPKCVVRSGGCLARALSDPGRQYGIYLEGRSPCQLRLSLPDGTYEAEWCHAVSGKQETAARVVSADGTAELQTPGFAEAIALRLVRQNELPAE